MKGSYYVTSYYQPGSIVLKLSGLTLTVKNLPNQTSIPKALFEIVDYNGTTVISEVFSRVSYENGIDLPELLKGVYFLRIFFPSKQSNMYKGVMFKSDIPFYCSNNQCRFIETVVAKPNTDFFKALSKPIPPNSQAERIRIKNLTKSLIQNINNDYQKIIAIHDWIAKNISYDYDALADINNSKICKVKPIDVIECKRTICQGYTDLSIAMLKSAGIPAMGIICFALGVDTTGGWEKQENLNAGSNHVFTAAFCDDRWILMDITWDSDNEYKNGIFRMSNAPVSHKYFDVTLNFLSNTHKIIKVQQ